MTCAKKMANNFRVTVFSEVYEFVFDDCMKTVEHSEKTISKSGPRCPFLVLMLINFHYRFEQFLAPLALGGSVKMGMRADENKVATVAVSKQCRGEKNVKFSSKRGIFKLI